MTLIEYELLLEGFVRLSAESFVFERRSGKQCIRVSLHSDGTIRARNHYIAGRLCRPYKKGPAVEIFSRDGQLCLAQYYRSGDCHRPLEDGPAHIEYQADGEISYESYWLYGNFVKIGVDQTVSVRQNDRILS